MRLLPIGLIVLTVVLGAFRGEVAASELSIRFLGSREGDPSSLVENVSTIHGDYSESEVDLIVPGPDPLVVSRFYSSNDRPSEAHLGGWRFYPECTLSVVRNAKPKSYSTPEGRFEKTHIRVGTEDGGILTYVGWKNTTNSAATSIYKIDIEDEVFCLANTARGPPSAWTNVKGNELIYYGDCNAYELSLCSGGKRVYLKHPSQDFYYLDRETLPSGNRVFYEYDTQGRLVLICLKNCNSEKTLSWIKIEYGTTIHVETSDGKIAEYHFDRSHPGHPLLVQVVRSYKPSVDYQYNVLEGQTLLTRKGLSEGEFTEIAYLRDNQGKYRASSVRKPATRTSSSVWEFNYSIGRDGSGVTEILGPEGRRLSHRYNEDLQLVAIEEYLKSKLYRASKRLWGSKKDLGNLVQSSVEDGQGNTLYAKTFSYNDKGHLIQEGEYGNFTGAKAAPLLLKADGKVDPAEEGHLKAYSYYVADNMDVIEQVNARKSGVRFYYRKGTNLLLRKFILEWDNIRKRWFYDYNDDGALCQIIVDDGDDRNPKSTQYLRHRLITEITPKQALPNVGIPEIIEEKYWDSTTKKNLLLKKTVSHFDEQGNVIRQEVYDANEKSRYSLEKSFVNGHLVKEVDPFQGEIHYEYDGLGRLTKKENRSQESSCEYTYELGNQLASIREGHRGQVTGSCFAYDSAGRRTSQIDPFGSETRYIYDQLGRAQAIYYPEIRCGDGQCVMPVYSYQYDLFDHIIAVEQPDGGTLRRQDTVRGSPIHIQYPDGTEELFKYDLEGSLHRHCSKDGTVRVFEYDYQGRLVYTERYARSEKQPGSYLGQEKFSYDAFYLKSHEDDRQLKTTYSYDGAGRVISATEGSRKFDFFYDPLGRTCGIKKWKSPTSYTYIAKEYDLRGKLIEERAENTEGKPLSKAEWVYDSCGRIAEIIGYPNNERRCLRKYEYDGLGRITNETDPYGHATSIAYKENLTDWGQKVRQATIMGPLGNLTEEVYDCANRPTTIVKKSSAGKILLQRDFFYDLVGNEVCQKATGGKTAPSPFTLDKDYDQGHRLIAFHSGVGTQGETSEYFEYNRYGDLIRHSDANGEHCILYEYLKTAHLNKISYKESSKDVACNILYDSRGRVTELKMPSTLQSFYKWDADNRLQSEEIAHEQSRYKVSYTYDDESSVSSIELPDGSKICYEYDGPFVSSITRFSREGTELYSHRIFARDLMGNALQEILPGHCGLKKTRFDQGGRSIGISTDFSRDAIPEGGYDPLGAITKRELAIDDDVYPTSYAYDALGRLTEEAGGAPHDYAYDAIGNRIRKDNVEFKVNGANQLIEAGDSTYTYDSRGNLATRSLNGETWRYSYNSLNQLVEVELPKEEKVSFLYDLRGRRLVKTIQSGGKLEKFRYFYLGETELGCIDDHGAIVELRVPSNPQSPGSSPAVAIEAQGSAYVPITDLQGNITCLIDPNSRRIEESYRYSAFGEEEVYNRRGRKLQSSAIGNPWRFRSARCDEELELIYFGSRYYSSSLGRWISPDPARDLDGPNPYLYCHNNPLFYVDYSGLASQERESPVDRSYFYGEYEPHCFCERHRDCKKGGDISDSFPLHSGWSLSSVGRLPLSVFAHPRLQGALQLMVGLTEFGIGSGVAVGSSGIGGVLGFAIVGHSLDHIQAGAMALLNGRYTETATSQMLQKAGISPGWSHTIDDGLALAATFRGAAVLNTMRSTALPAFMASPSMLTLIAQEAPIALRHRAFTGGNFRYNLKQRTGLSPGREMDAHHVLPQQFRDKFLKRGINIDDPRYGTWWERSSHRSYAKAYNEEWGAFFKRNPGFTPSQALGQGKEMMLEHNIQVNY